MGGANGNDTREMDTHRTSVHVDHSRMWPHERLRAWKACHRLALEVYRSTESWPKREMFGLAAQSRRAAYSAAANIAEGMAKQGVRELRRFLDMSVGSLSELSYALQAGSRLGIRNPGSERDARTTPRVGRQANLGVLFSDS